MPLRTRDFLLYLISFAFLVIAIFVTILRDVSLESNNVASVISAEYSSEEVIYTAVVEEKSVLDRAGHLATLRSKIAEFKDKMSESSPVPEPVEVSPIENSNEEAPVVLVAEFKCPLYQKYSKVWSPQELNFLVVEGARLLYKEIESSSLVNTLGSLTSSTEPVKEVLLQLPLQSYGATKKNCLPSDVVGIALDGSLIKNNEYGLYSIFGPETLLGYALDGFPIYGQTELKTDECGGVFIDGQYGYYLSNEREVVLYCYSGTPVEI